MRSSEINLAMSHFFNNINLPDSYISSLIALRQDLHQHAERSGEEEKTKQIILDFVSPYAPHQIVSPLGGQGLAIIYQANSPGLSLLFRAEMDAVPIAENADRKYKSLNASVSHMCGHDGQMTILAGLAGLLHYNPPQQGKIILLFQHAEETGQGASAMVNDPNFIPCKPDYVFALHNLPGKEKGVVYLSSGVFNCASVGMIIQLIGKSAHASTPDDGISPTLTMCEIIHELQRLPAAPQLENIFSMATVVYARLGEDSFGTTPKDAEVRATLRCEDDRGMESLENMVTQLVVKHARRQGLRCNIKWCDRFTVGRNDARATEIISAAAKTAGLKVKALKRPLPWSEDFGQFTARFPGAMFLLGAGKTCPPLHSPEYDFPDDLIEIGLRIYWEIINQIIRELIKRNTEHLKYGATV